MSFTTELSRLEARVLLSVAEPTAEKVTWHGAPIDAAAGEVVVQFNVGKTTSIRKQRQIIRAAIQPAVNEMYASEYLGSPGSFVVTFDPSKRSVESALQFLSKAGRVRSAEPNEIVTNHGDAAPNDPGYNFNYHLNNTGANGSIAGTPDADIDAPEAWNITTGSKDVVLAILDTGIELTHPDLAGNLFTNPNEIPGDGIDNDYNGKIDDVHGWNFISNNNNANDDAGHGTVIAGVAGGVGNNGIGTTGVNWNVSLLPVRWRQVTSSGGQVGVVSDAISAVNYIVGLKQRGVNIRVANNSYGDVKSIGLRDAYQRAIDNGIVLIASAGNEGNNNDVTPRFPTNYDQMITVGATDAWDRLASFSNYGSSVELAAPGKDVYATLLTQWGGYGRTSGTSFAAASVSGGVALMAAAKPTATYTELRNALLGGVDVIPALAGTNATSGRLNAYKSLQVLLGNATPGPVPAIGKGTITGKVYNDADGWGYLDAGESGVAGVTVYADANQNGQFDAGEATAVSGADGTYKLTRLSLGNYQVRAIEPAGLRTSSPEAIYYVDYGVTLASKHVGLTPYAFASGKVLFDNDNSGTSTAGDTAAASWRVFADLNNDGIFNGSDRRVTTDAAGNFTFRTLTAGSYSLVLEVQSGHVATSSAATLLNVTAGGTYANLFFGVRPIA